MCRVILWSCYAWWLFQYLHSIASGILQPHICLLNTAFDTPQSVSWCFHGLRSHPIYSGPNCEGRSSCQQRICGWDWNEDHLVTHKHKCLRFRNSFRYDPNFKHICKLRVNCLKLWALTPCKSMTAIKPQLECASLRCMCPLGTFDRA